MQKGEKKKAKASAVEKCIFYEPSKSHLPLDYEHVWGKWLKKIVRSDMNKHHLREREIGRPRSADKTKVTLRAGDPLQMSLKIVCKACNSGWMSRTQNDAKPFLIPLIQGRKTVLGEKGQKAIAAWCAMATMTGEYSVRDENAVAVSQAERNWIRDQGSPPENWKIWIGYYPSRKGGWNHYVVPVLGSEDGAKITDEGFALPNSQTTTFAIGNLFVHVFSSTGDPDMVAKWEWPLGTRIALNLPRIFPSKESVIVWPSNGLSEAEVRQVSSLFERVIDGASRSILGLRLV